MQQQEYQLRRKQLLQQIPQDSAVIISAAPEYLRNGDCPYLFRQDSDFYYLTGFPETDAVAVLLPEGEQGEYILFCQPHDELYETWNGPRVGQDGAEQHYQADKSYSIENIDELMPGLLKNRSTIYFQNGKYKKVDEQIAKWVKDITAKVRAGINAPTQFINLGSILNEMRLCKKQSELEKLRHVANISANAHKRAMRTCKPGMMEYELEAELIYEFNRHGCKDVAYTPIVGGGKNACVLHYINNDAKLNDGELVLIDAGAEYQHYASDITRTFPINGRFNKEQRLVYEAVLAAQLVCINAVKPGLKYNELQQLSVRKITEGLVKINLLQGDIDKLIETKAYQKFYMHNVSHWMGIDVHDVGSYKVAGEWRELQPGFVLTIEPGIYISENTDGVAPEWWNIGIRIEDDVLVTETGHEVLTAAVPKTIEEIEALMAEGK